MIESKAYGSGGRKPASCKISWNTFSWGEHLWEVYYEENDKKEITRLKNTCKRCGLNLEVSNVAVVVSGAEE